MTNPKVLLLAIFVAFFPTQVNASQNLYVSIAPQNLSPVRIDACAPALIDSRYNENYYLEEAVAFTVTGDKTATLVEFRFDLYDGFGDTLGDRFAQRDGTFSPGVPIQIRRAALTGDAIMDFSDINIWPSLRTVRCSINRVLFADGTTWKA